MTRFHIVVLTAAVWIVLALALQHFTLLVAIVLALLVAMGFGVAVPQLRFFGGFICRGGKTKKRVALTFDDGPDPRSTPRLLELLREEKIQAAFFA